MQLLRCCRTAPGKGEEEGKACYLKQSTWLPKETLPKSQWLSIVTLLFPLTSRKEKWEKSMSRWQLMAYKGKIFRAQTWITHQSPLIHCLCTKSLQSCLAHGNPMDYGPPGSSVHGILQARILEWVAISFSRASSWPRDQTHITYVSCIGRHVLYH